MGCGDWQGWVAKSLNKYDIIVANPRIDYWDSLDDDGLFRQTQWEHNAMELSDMIAFWFCRDDVQPLSLFELGRWSYTEKRIVVGASPMYPMLRELKSQMAVVRPEMKIEDSLKGLAQSIIKRGKGIEN